MTALTAEIWSATMTHDDDGTPHPLAAAVTQAVIRAISDELRHHTDIDESNITASAELLFTLSRRDAAQDGYQLEIPSKWTRTGNPVPLTIGADDAADHFSPRLAA